AETSPRIHGSTAPPVFPLAKTGLLAWRVESPNQSGNKDTLMGKIEAIPNPARSDPTTISAIPCAAISEIPPSTADTRPARATVLDEWNLSAAGASARPNNSAP